MSTKFSVLVADEVWIATALLHREHPKAEDFAVREIVARAEMENLTERLRPGVYVHAVQHCVANRPANPGRYRMLLETARDRRRLYRPGDPYHPSREGAKTRPERGAVPVEHAALLDWYEREYCGTNVEAAAMDPILLLRGSGRRLWSDESADEYVRRLREGWE